LFKAFIV